MGVVVGRVGRSHGRGHARGGRRHGQALALAVGGLEAALGSGGKCRAGSAQQLRCGGGSKGRHDGLRKPGVDEQLEVGSGRALVEGKQAALDEVNPSLGETVDDGGL